jgi:hypothetical protein
VVSVRQGCYSAGPLLSQVFTNTNTNTNTLLNLSTPVMYNSNNNMHYYNELANIEHLNNLNGIMGNMGHWIRIG